MLKAKSRLGILLALLSLPLIGWLAEQEVRLFLAFAVVTVAVAYLWGLGIASAWHGLWRSQRRGLYLLGLMVLLPVLPLYGWFVLEALRPDLLPQRTSYDFIANRHITERLVDPALIKADRWDILGQEKQVLFVHPAAAGSTALVYPLKIEPRTTLQADLAVAPEAWTAEGDGVTFSVYVEDEAGMHLVYSRYVDPKHHQQDKRWLPMRVSLSAFDGKLVRLILVTNSGPAGDLRYDWAGWGELCLKRPIWP